MPETQTPETQATGYQRVFWPSDYRKSAALIRNMRHVRCDRYTAKDAAAQEKADTLAIAMAGVFANDAAGFNPVVFIEGTRLPEPQASETGDETGDESDAGGGLLP
jgi:hypothetical protein